MKYIFLKNLLILLIMLLLIFKTQSLIAPIQSKKKFLSPPENIKYFTLGYGDVIASSLWLRLLQDFEYCEGGKHKAEDFVLPLENEEGVNRVLKRKLKSSKCDKGWVYKMLNSITSIEPKFKLAYETGGVMLSVVVDDRQGAKLIFEKGLEKYPDDWQLNFAAAYHYLWETQEPKLAAIHYNRAANSPNAPPWVPALSAALFTQVGEAKVAKAILEDALKKRPTGPGSERIRIRLDEVNKILQEKP